MAVGNLTSRLADFVVSAKFEQLPPEVVVAGKQAFMDNLGVAMAGSMEPAIDKMVKIVRDGGDRGRGTVVGKAATVSPLNAALINGQSAHGPDFDDTQHGRGTHMSSPVAPAVAAIGEARHARGKDVLGAFIVGFEIGCHLGGAKEFGDHMMSKSGVHPTGYLGAFGAVAGVGNLVRLEPEKMRQAFGHAGAQASGMRVTFGTEGKPLNAANGARAGLLSALLAEAGVSGPQDVFDAEYSVFRQFDFKVTPEEVLKDLGGHWEVTHNMFKGYACAGWRNPIVWTMMEIATKNNLKGEDVAEITVEIHPKQLSLPNYSAPKTGLEGKFSVEHAAAVAFIDHAGGLKQFSDERVNDSGVLALRAKVRQIRSERFKPYQIESIVRTNDGRTFKVFVPVPKGDQENPYTMDELEGKFRGNAALVLPARRVAKLADMVRNIEEVEDFAELMVLCRAAR